MKRKTAIVVTPSGWVLAGYEAQSRGGWEFEDLRYYIVPRFSPDAKDAFVFDSAYYAQRAINRINLKRSREFLALKYKLAVVS